MLRDREDERRPAPADDYDIELLFGAPIAVIEEGGGLRPATEEEVHKLAPAPGG